jgi:hypothetical protein
VAQAYPERDKLLDNLDANGSIGPWKVRDLMAKDSGVLSIVGDVIAGGAGTVTVEYYVDEACTKGGSSTDTMDATSLYILHKVVSPDLWFKLTMTGRDTDDINFYAV